LTVTPVTLEKPTPLRTTVCPPGTRAGTLAGETELMLGAPAPVACSKCPKRSRHRVGRERFMMPVS